MMFASTAASAVVAHQSASAEAKSINASNELARNIARQDEQLSQMDIARQRQQEYEAAAGEANSYASQALRERGEMDAILGEGFAGNTGERRTAAMGIRQGNDMATLNSNASKVQAELGYASMAASNTRNQRIASLRDATGPSAFGTALTIAGSAMRTGQDINKINGKTK